MFVQMGLLNYLESQSPVYTRLLTRVGMLIQVGVDTPNPASNLGLPTHIWRWVEVGCS